MDWLVQNGQVVNMVAIVVICGFLGFAIKTGCAGNEKVLRWIPLIVGFTGGVLGVVYRFINPDYAHLDVLMAIASGIISGLASTGVHQVVKQAAQKPDGTNTGSSGTGGNTGQNGTG